MSNITTITKAAGVLVVLVALQGLGAAQADARPDFTAKFVAGSTVRYEFEGMVHISTEHAPGVKLNAPSDCSYQVRTVLKFDFKGQTRDGSWTGQVSFEGLNAQIPECASAGKARVDAAIKELSARLMGFEILSGGDVRLTETFREDEPELVSILHKAAWDLLQPKVSDRDVTRNSPWGSDKAFLYWPDTFVEGTEVAAASGHYARDVEIGAAKCALLEYRQVFSPTDIPAYVEARSRAKDFSGTTMITGQGAVSLLWDRAERRIVYLHRRRTIDNRLTLKYDPNDENRSVARFLMEEESTARWLPEKSSDLWLAELHRFESSANPDVVTQKKPVKERHEISNLQDRVPRGFERWRKTYCENQFCFELSFAVPEGTVVAQSSGMTVLLLGGSGDRTLRLAAGPILDLQTSGLTDEELLRQQTSRFIRNNLWFARGTGDPLNFSSETLRDRPAGLSDFSSKARDLSPLTGRLAMVIGPYQRLVPVGCAHNDSQPDLDAVCQTVIESIVIE